MSQAPVLHTLDEAAARFRVSRRVFQDFVKEHPFYRVLGRRKLFTDADLSRLYEMLQCPSSSSDGTAALTGTSVAPSAASLSTKLQALLTKPPPKRSARAASGKSCKVVSLEGRRSRRS